MALSSGGAVLVVAGPSDIVESFADSWSRQTRAIDAAKRAYDVNPNKLAEWQRLVREAGTYLATHSKGLDESLLAQCQEILSAQRALYPPADPFPDTASTVSSVASTVVPPRKPDPNEKSALLGESEKGLWYYLSCTCWGNSSAADAKKSAASASPGAALSPPSTLNALR